jgi:shikimate dehydrogenase
MSDARRAAVLGHPIAHSLSPRPHRAANAALGLAGWRYDAVDVTEDALPAFLDALDGSWAGLSLTMPLKQTVLGLLDHVEPLASVVGAVNTVLVQPGGRRPPLTGANTHEHGNVPALGEAGALPPADHGTGAAADLHAGHAHAGHDHGADGAGRRSAAVLGAGATAASALAALAELGCPTPTVYVRSLGRVGPLSRAAHRMGVEPTYRPLAEAAAGLREVDLVVSTLPPGAADDLVPDLLAGAPVRPGAALLDVAYDPRRSALMAAWERLLLHQAGEQVRLMTGRPAPLEAMDRALDEALPGA